LRYLFEDYALDIDRRELRRHEALIALEPQVFDLLAYLLRNRDRVVTKTDLLAAIWHGRIVSESAMTTRINAARHAVADSGAEQRLIKTLHRKGIRFVGAVREQGESADHSGLVQAASLAPRLDRSPPLVTDAPAESRRGGPRLPDKPSIAVLPFANLCGDPEQDYFADGIVDDITTALSHLHGLFVIARNSTFTYKGHPIDVQQVGRALGVRYILEGSVRRFADRVRITAQLVEAEPRAHIWADHYDRTIGDIFAIQDEITNAITAAIEPEISASEQDRARRKPPEQLGAWELYQRGMWHLLRHNYENSLEAERLFHSAIALDPGFAAPHAARALVDFFQIPRAQRDHDPALLDAMFREAARAAELDPKDSLGHVALGLHHMQRGEFAQSICEHKVALVLNPNSAFAHWGYGFVLIFAERFAEALDEFDAALRLNPRDPAKWPHLATLKAGTLYQLRRYEEAAASAHDAIRSATADVVWSCVHLAAAAGQLGRTIAVALAELERRRPGLTLSAFRSWSMNRLRSERALGHIVEGLRKAGLPE
jgi:TolB-like protein/DNA-binding winged helix-turn-helix (wHTH) protein/Flp pilus assembly protein TadD